MTAARTRPARARLVLVVLAMAAALALWSYGAVHSPLLDRQLATERAFARREAIAHGPDAAAERALAEAYWRRYPDVAKDPVFGRHGSMGVFGARAHYRLHGRREGRHWGP